MASVAALACAVGLASAAFAASEPVLTDRQDGARLRVHPRETLTVRLASNPSTGFTWRVVAGPPALQLVMQRYDALPRPPRGVTGAAGVQTFRLRAVGPPGRVVALELAYNRWWKAMPLARVWSARVVITR